MKIRSSPVFTLIGMATLWGAATPVFGQVALVPQEQVFLFKLSPPIFPPLTRAARVLIDVEIALRIRQDGRFEAAEAVRGTYSRFSSLSPNVLSFLASMDSQETAIEFLAALSS